jgi:hypothetical protein
MDYSPIRLGCQERDSGRPVRKEEIDTLPIAEILHRHVGDRSIDFMSIDVEGHEQAVLSTADFTRWRPRVLIVEATGPGTNVPSHQKWEVLVTTAGYLFALFDGINRFYVRQEDRDWVNLLGIPANFLDGALTAREAELSAWEAELARLARIPANHDGALTARVAELARLGELYQQYGQAARFAAGGVQWVMNRIRKLIR